MLSAENIEMHLLYEGAVVNPSLRTMMAVGNANCLNPSCIVFIDCGTLVLKCSVQANLGTLNEFLRVHCHQWPRAYTSDRVVGTPLLASVSVQLNLRWDNALGEDQYVNH
jgi:hypothetical protein